MSHNDLTRLTHKNTSTGAGESRPTSAGREAPIDPSHTGTTGIESMLASTGTRPSEGPLIDFHKDVAESLPANIKRAETSGSKDEFVDAQE